tara:strand:+ start:970 stop:1206 length:237 start_codon:yes stop_codon:yes gene_type:complete
MNKETKTPIESIDSYADYLEAKENKLWKTAKLDDGELLDLVIDVTTQEPSPEGLPTDRDILMSINNALYHHFNEESAS